MKSYRGCGGNMEAEDLGPFQDIILEEKISSRLRKSIKCQVLKIKTSKTDTCNNFVHGILCDKRYMLAATFSENCIKEFEGAKLHAELEGAYIDVQEYIIYPSVEREEENLEFLLCIEDFKITKEYTVQEKNENLLSLSKNEGIKQRLRYLSKLNKFAKSLKNRGSSCGGEFVTCQKENYPDDQASQDLTCSGVESEKNSSPCLKSVVSDLGSNEVVPKSVAIEGDSGCNQGIDVFHKPHRTVVKKALPGSADDTASRPMRYVREPLPCRGSNSNTVHDSSRSLIDRKNKLVDADDEYHEIEASQGFIVSKDAQKELLAAKQISILEPDSSLLSAEDSAIVNKESGVAQLNNLNSLENDQEKGSLIQRRISNESMSQYMETDEDQNALSVLENGKAKALEGIKIIISAENMTVNSSESATAKYSPISTSNNEQACEKDAEHQVSPIRLRSLKRKREDSSQNAAKEAAIEVVSAVVREKQENFDNKWTSDGVWQSILAFWTDRRNHPRRQTTKERLQLLERFHKHNGK